jgi:hypothetical protein
MDATLLGGGVGALVGGVVVWVLQKTFEHQMKERLSHLESQLKIQSQWIAARLVRVDQRRTRTLSRLHTSLDDALHITDSYVGSHDAGNDESRLEELRISAIRTWIAFSRYFERAEIFLSERLAENIRNYGSSIADIRVEFESNRRRLPATSTLEARLASINRALASLNKIRSEIRLQLIKEIRQALGADSLDPGPPA